MPSAVWTKLQPHVTAAVTRSCRCDPRCSARPLNRGLPGVTGVGCEPFLPAPGIWACGAGSGRARMGAGRGPSPKVSRPRPAMGAMEARGALAALCGVTLLCALGLGQRPAGGLSCGPERLLRGTGTDARCCRPCVQGKARGEPVSERSSAAPSPCARTRPPRRGGQIFWVRSPGTLGNG